MKCRWAREQVRVSRSGKVTQPEKKASILQKDEGISKAIDCSMHYKKAVRTCWSKLFLPFSPKLMYIATVRHSLQYIASKTRV